jgi:hypothetical protein
MVKLRSGGRNGRRTLFPDSLRSHLRLAFGTKSFCTTIKNIEIIQLFLSVAVPLRPTLRTLSMFGKSAIVISLGLSK